MNAVTINRIILPDNRIKSTIRVDGFVFQISSTFDGGVKLTDVLLSVANVIIIKSRITANDTTKRMMYTFGEENSHIDA